MHDNDEWAGTEEEYAQGSRLSVVSEDWGKSGWSLYAFASANARYQAYDLFLDEPGGEDGDVVRGGSAVTSKKSRTETSLGVVAANGPARLTFAWTEESRRYDQQPDKHKYGEVTLGRAF